MLAFFANPRNELQRTFFNPNGWFGTRCEYIALRAYLIVIKSLLDQHPYISDYF